MGAKRQYGWYRRSDLVPDISVAGFFYLEDICILYQDDGDGVTHMKKIELNTELIYRRYKNEV